MQKHITILAISLLLVGINQSKALDVATYCKTLSNPSLAESSFPYALYLQETNLMNILALENDRKTLATYKIDGTTIFSKVIDTYIKHKSRSFANLDSLAAFVAIGERFMLSSQYIDDTTYFYSAYGDKMLSMATDTLENAIKNKRVELNNKKVLLLVNRLEENKFRFNFPASDMEKAWSNFEKGNFSYLWRRLSGRYFWQFILTTILGVASISFLSITIYKRWCGIGNRR